MRTEGLSQEELILTLKRFKEELQPDGLRLVGIFGSYARGEYDRFSDVDIAYEIDAECFSEHYRDGFSKLLRIEALKQSLQQVLHKKVDLIALGSNRIFAQQIAKEMIYV